MPHEKHRGSGPGKISVVLVTVSTSRYAAKSKKGNASDESGDVASREIGKLGYRVARRELVSDEPEMIRHQLRRCRLVRIVTLQAVHASKGLVLMNLLQVLRLRIMAVDAQRLIRYQARGLQLE
jgi:hypothetical protein